MLYLIMMREAIKALILPNNPYWEELNFDDAPKVYAFTKSLSLAREFMYNRNPEFFAVTEYDGEPDEFLSQRPLDVYHLQSDYGKKEEILSLMEFEYIQTIGMTIMKGYSDKLLSMPTSVKNLYPNISEALLTLGFGSFYEIIYSQEGSKVSPNFHRILLDNLGWSFRRNKND